jgi:hypothetical protein
MGTTIDIGFTETRSRSRAWAEILLASVGLLALASVLVGDTDRRANPVHAAAPPQRPLERVSLASLEGQVRSGLDFAPLPGVRVVLASATDTLTLHTDSQGRFSLALVEPGEIEVRVEPAEPWQPASRRLAVAGGRNELELVVAQGPTGAVASRASSCAGWPPDRGITVER